MNLECFVVDSPARKLHTCNRIMLQVKHLALHMLET